MKKRHTFTLVEILTTIAILAILAGISLGVTKLAFGKAHESKNQALIKMIEVALEQYKSKYGYYPNSGDKPRLFTMDMVDLTLAADESDNDKKKRVLTNNIWQYFDEDFKKTFVKQTPLANNDIFYGYVIDAKGNPLIYRCPGIFNTGSFDLGSVGEDGYIGDKVELINQGTKLENIAHYENFGQGDDIVNFTNNEQ